MLTLNDFLIQIRQIFLFLTLSAYLTACTYNISMVHTEGQASDVIDETSTQNPNISPNLDIPISGAK